MTSYAAANPGHHSGHHQPTTFAVLADPHLYDSRLGTTGEAFEMYLAQDRKLLRESEAIADAAVAALLEAKPDFVLVAGDLTKDGCLSSHLKMAAKLRRLERAGIAVYVVPGNHDINNPHAFAYDGPDTFPVQNVSPRQFKGIYARFGYSQACDRDPHSLSYAACPAKDVYLLAIDSCIYGENEELGYPVTGGRIRPETLAWIQDKAARAQANGKTVIAFMHHGVLEHYYGQTQLFPDYVIEDWQTVSQTLAQAGVNLVFTGHFHALDISMKTWQSEDGTPYSLYDVETGSLVTYPCPYRTVTLRKAGIDIDTSTITEIDYDTGGLSFHDYAYGFLYQGLLGQAKYQLMHDFGLPGEQADFIAPWIASAFVAHYAGDEMPDAETMEFIQYLIGTPDSTVEMLGYQLLSLWSDLPPADAAITIAR
jgi:3',5'-cyclic AMP phosphodiesterase CpdA